MESNRNYDLLQDEIISDENSEEEYLPVANLYMMEKLSFLNGHPEISIANLEIFKHIKSNIGEFEDLLLIKKDYQKIFLVHKEMEKIKVVLKEKFNLNDKMQYTQTKQIINKTHNIIVNRLNYLNEKSKHLCEKISNELNNYGLKRKLRYCNDNSKKKFKVSIINNKFCIGENNEILDSLNLYKKEFGTSPEEDEKDLNDIITKYNIDGTSSKKSSFSCIIIDKNKDLYVFPFKAGVSHHSFLTFNDDVLFAGTGLFENGKISVLSNHSGHYQTPFKYIRKVFFPKIMKMYNGDIKNLFVDNFQNENDNDVNFNRIIENKKTGLFLSISDKITISSLDLEINVDDNLFYILQIIQDEKRKIFSTFFKENTNQRKL